MLTALQVKEKDKQCKTIPSLTNLSKEAKMSLSLLLCARISFELSSSFLRHLKFSSWVFVLDVILPSHEVSLVYASC